MKITPILSLLLTVGATSVATAQTPPPNTQGKLSYEVMRRIDLSQMRMVINGQEVRPGSADAPADIPDVITSQQHLVFSGTSAKEILERPANMMRTVTRGPGGPGGADGPGVTQTRTFTPPFQQEVFINLASGQRVEVLTLKKDSLTKEVYSTERALPARPADWQETNKTKKIAGYTCRKATATRRVARMMVGVRQGGPGNPAATPPAPEAGPAESYTIWYTTELPFTYSPLADLTPPQGVVLQIESDNESYKATGLATDNVAPTVVTPPADAKALSNDEFQQQFARARATFRQRMMTQAPR